MLEMNSNAVVPLATEWFFNWTSMDKKTKGGDRPPIEVNCFKHVPLECSCYKKSKLSMWKKIGRKIANYWRRLWNKRDGTHKKQSIRILLEDNISEYKCYRIPPKEKIHCNFFFNISVQRRSIIGLSLRRNLWQA